MREYLQSFIKLAEGMKEKHTEEDMRELLTHIRFFQHERLIHLIVTITVAMALIIISLFTITNPSVMLFILDLLLLVLLIPYIMHYYFLENGVQKLYAIYDCCKGIKF